MWENIVVILLVMGILNIVLWVWLMPWYVNRRISRFQNELVDDHYAEVETMYRKMRGWRHDYHNHIQVLKAYMEMKQYREAEQYLTMVAEDLQTVDTVLKTGNVMVDAILNSKLTMIKEKEIAVDATAVVPQNIGIAGVDLAVLIGNMLDNAMEACMRVPNKEDRFLRIYIDIVKKQLYISVTNSTHGKVERNGMRFISSKQGVHGFGLLRIDSIVAKYGGFLNRQSENNVFATEVLLPLENDALEKNV